jgi:hypothetical protein
MPLWLDLLRTPMAAPETPALRRMRRTLQGLCLSVALMVGFFAQIHAAIGRAAPCFAAALLVGAGLYTALYLRRKNAADNAFLERAGEPG